MSKKTNVIKDEELELIKGGFGTNTTYYFDVNDGFVDDIYYYVVTKPATNVSGTDFVECITFYKGPYGFSTPRDTSVFVENLVKYEYLGKYDENTQTFSK